MSYFGYRLAAMAAVAEGPQPVDVSQWADVLTEVAGMLNNTTVSALGVLLRDKDALRAALRGLDNAELGDVLGMALSRLDEVGDTPLPDLLRLLADQVEKYGVAPWN